MPTTTLVLGLFELCGVPMFYTKERYRSFILKEVLPMIKVPLCDIKRILEGGGRVWGVLID